MGKQINGAELLQLILDKKIKDGDKIEILDDYTVYTYIEGCSISDNGTLWLGNTEVRASQLLNGTFQLIEKPVSFMEAVKSDGRIKVDISGLGLTIKVTDGTICDLNSYQSLSEILRNLYKHFFSCDISKIITYGKWYIERE